MIKNRAGQKIGAQMVATDGTAFTGAVTVYITGDAGTQAIGSVGSGACTHEGNGYHTYSPSQAETNYNLIGATFIGTGAVPATPQYYTLDLANYLIKDIGVPSAVTANTVTLEGGAPHLFGANSLAGNILSIYGSTQGYWQEQEILSNTGADPVVVTLKDNWPVTPTGTFADRIFGTPAGSTANPAEVRVVSMATDAISAAAVSAAAVTKIQVGLALATAVDAVDNFLDTEVAAMMAVLVKLDTTMELNAGSYRFTIPALAQAPSGTGASAASIRAEMDSNSTRLAAIQTSTDNLPVDTEAMLATLSGYIDTEITTLINALALVKAQTDKLIFNGANRVEVAIKTVHNTNIQGTGTTLDPWRPA